MKKLLAGVATALVLVGGGCADNIPLIGGVDTVEGKWRLAFDLPQDWVMVEDYDSPRSEIVTPSLEVTRDLSDVIVQSTSKAIVSGGVSPDSEVAEDSFIGSDFTQIHVYYLDERRIIPSEAEDLDGGWYRLKLCEAGEDCTIYGQYNYDYYLVAASGSKYKFSIITNNQDPQAAVAVIMSAKEVTDFTDAPTVSAETQ